MNIYRLIKIKIYYFTSKIFKVFLLKNLSKPSRYKGFKSHSEVKKINRFFKTIKKI